MPTKIPVYRPRGLASRQRYATLEGSTSANIAEDVDIFNGVIEPIKSDESIETAGTSNRVVKVNGNWVTNRHQAIRYFTGRGDGLIYQTPNGWFKEVGGNQYTLGIEIPRAPSVSRLEYPPPGDIQTTVTPYTGDAVTISAGDYLYKVTQSKTINGQTIESGSSNSSSVTVTNNQQVTITRPDLDSDTSLWNIYRSSDGGATY